MSATEPDPVPTGRTRANWMWAIGCLVFAVVVIGLNAALGGPVWVYFAVSIVIGVSSMFRTSVIARRQGGRAS